MERTEAVRASTEGQESRDSRGDGGGGRRHERAARTHRRNRVDRHDREQRQGSYDGKREKFARNEISFWIDFFMSTAYTIDSIKKLFYGFYMGGVATAS